MPRFRLSFLPALLALLSGNAWADLRTYDVDPQHRDEIYIALRRTLEPQGRVELLPTGQILVNAEAATLEQVEQVLQAIRARPAPAAPQVSLRYWAVLGTRAQANAQANGQVSVCVAGGCPDSGELTGSAPPAMLEGVLSELRRLHSDVTFRVIGTAAVTSYSGQRGEIKGTSLSVEQTAHVQDNTTLNAAISMELRSSAGLPIGQSVQLSSLTLRTTLDRGQFVVLGESHFKEPVTGVEGPVFYIVHWSR